MKYAAHSSVLTALVLAETEVDFPSAEERRWAWSNPGQLERAQGAGHLAACNTFSTSKVFDELRRPVDKKLFMRMLNYYEIRSQAERPSGAPTKTNVAQPAAAAHRRKP